MVAYHLHPDWEELHDGKSGEPTERQSLAAQLKIGTFASKFMCFFCLF